MASGQTANYQLNQWEAEDKVLRTEFNADNAKLDAALAGLAAALFLARRERLGPASLVTAGIILVMVCIRAMLREALLRPYHPVREGHRCFQHQVRQR